MSQYFSIFPGLSMRFFTPAEIYKLSGVSPQQQRLWRHRGVVPFDRGAEGRDRISTWEQVMQWAVMIEVQNRGLDLSTAGKIAASEMLRQLHCFDFRKQASGDSPLLIICRMTEDGEIVVSTLGGKMEFNTADAFWGNFGFWINYSEIQRRVVDAYVSLIS